MARANTHGRENEERLSPDVGAAAPGLAESWAPRRADDPARGNALARRRRCGRVLCREAVGKCGKTAVSGSGREAAQECNVRGLPRGQRLLSRSRRHRRTCIWRTASQVSRGDTVRHWRRRGHDGRDRSGHLRTQRSRRRARAADGTNDYGAIGVLDEITRHAAEERRLGFAASACPDDNRLGVDASCHGKHRSRDAAIALFDKRMGLHACRAQTPRALLRRSPGPLEQQGIEVRGVVHPVTPTPDPDPRPSSELTSVSASGPHP